MKPFRYLRDPLFVVCLAVYLINRLLIKRYWPNILSESYLNDLICIPFWVPIMLYAMRRMGWRRDDNPPAAHEILIPLVIWSFLFEAVAPYHAPYRGLAFGDPRDIFCYAVGALIAGVIWRS